jgi:hypothetical protein
MALLVTDRIDWALTEDNDLEIPLRFVVGLEAVTQGIRVRCGMIRGEWFMDRDLGVPLFEGDEDTLGVSADDAIFGQKFNRLKAIAAYREAILSTPGVPSNGIVAIDVDFDNPSRTMVVSWRVQTIFGDIVQDALTQEV